MQYNKSILIKKWSIALLCPLLVWLILHTTFVHAENPPDFRQLLEQAIQENKREVVIPPGLYRMSPPDGGGAHIRVLNARDMTIIADGVTVICEDLTRGIIFSHCDHVKIRGLTLDYDPLPFTQGTVTAIGGDSNSIEVTLHAGYPRKPYSRVDICDPKTRFRKYGMPFLWGSKAEMIAADKVRVSYPGIGKVAAVGDLVSLSTGPRNGGQPHGIAIENCSAMVFENITVYTAPGMGIIESDGEGGSRYVNCRVVPGPVPQGATEARLLSSTWDAMQSKTTRRGPVVEKCEIRDAGDDSWSVQSSDYVILKQDANEIVIGYRDLYCAGPQVGDKLAANGVSATATVKECHPVSSLREAGVSAEMINKVENAKSWNYWQVGGKFARLILVRDSPFKLGLSIYCPDRQGNGFVFRNNKLHSSGRILIKASDGIIENNTVINGHSGVTVCPEIPATSVLIHDLVIRNNSFTATGNFCPAPWSVQAGCISITDRGFTENNPLPYPTFANIRIEDNRFDQINSPAIVVTSANNVVIKGNQFSHMFPPGNPNDTGRDKGLDVLSLITLAGVSNAVISANRLTDMPATRFEYFRISADCANIRGVVDGIAKP